MEANEAEKNIYYFSSQEIAKGGQGTVYKAYYKKDDIICAVKDLNHKQP